MDTKIPLRLPPFWPEVCRRHSRASGGFVPNICDEHPALRSVMMTLLKVGLG